MEFEVQTVVNAHLQKVRSGFDEDLFRHLVPPGSRIEMLDFGGCTPGKTLRMNIRMFGVLRQHWENIIVSSSGSSTSWEFTDKGIQVPFPLHTWHHRHIVEEIQPGICRIRDHIQFTVRPYWLGFIVFPLIWLPFALRRSRYRSFFSAQEP